jgi:hypothetical protein
VWYIKGNVHRENGPAVEYAYGNREWWVHGKRHRTDGPAVEYVDGWKEWWIKDLQFRSEESHRSLVNETKDMVWQICSSRIVADPLFAEYFLKFLL